MKDEKGSNKDGKHDERLSSTRQESLKSQLENRMVIIGTDGTSAKNHRPRTTPTPDPKRK